MGCMGRVSINTVNFYWGFLLIVDKTDGEDPAIGRETMKKPRLMDDIRKPQSRVSINPWRAYLPLTFSLLLDYV